jgi:hypothetical protein
LRYHIPFLGEYNGNIRIKLFDRAKKKFDNCHTSLSLKTIKNLPRFSPLTHVPENNLFDIKHFAIIFLSHFLK